ncbi:RNA helicase family protein [Babesia divergens]|uniref:RNA helicase family protein n=1 Tax=Babesia divergens TaxID=32595 RepID=A0AAD9GE55_BABDI|nr:RNA helicase family protein [Babesia divergens]
MQGSAWSHFVGYLGEDFENEIKPRLDGVVKEYEGSGLSVAECAQRIIREFMAPLVKNFTKVEVMEPKLALDRELQVLYSADLAASYIILFCPLKVRHELYRYLWGHGAFLDGRINWLCCPWVLNQETHDEEYHKLALDLDKLTNEEVIDIIRLHKNYLSTDYVKQRSRSALKLLDRDSLMSVFQSVMLRVLWGREAVSETQNHRPSDDFVQSPEELEAIKREVENGEVKKEEIRMNTLRGWLDEYRTRRGCSIFEKVPKPTKLQLKETEYARQMKRSIEVINKHIEKFNEVFKGVPGDTPFIEAARKYSSERLPDVEGIDSDITINKIRNAFKTLLDFYRGNLASNSDLYGSLPNIQAIKLLKFLLSYEKHDLIKILSAVLLALPEFKPIVTDQDFAQYAMLPFNTLAKLCFIAIMRINPKIASTEVNIDLDDAEIRANSGMLMSSDRKKSGGFPTDNTLSTMDTDVDLDSSDGSDDEDHTASSDVSSMIFTSEELREVGNYINRKLCTIVDATIGNERQPCLILDSRRNCAVSEAVLLHLSNYDAVYEVLKDQNVETPMEQQDMTQEAIRKFKLSAVLKRMSETELDVVYQKVINSTKLHDDIKIPEDIYKLTFHCLLDNLETGIQDEEIYSKLSEICTRMEYEEPDVVMSSNINMEKVQSDKGDDTSCEHDSDQSSGDGHESEFHDKGEPVTERGHYLNLIEGEDITPFIDKSFSSHNPEEMTNDELRRVAEKVLERMETSEGCTIIHYNPMTSGDKPFTLHAIPATKRSTNAFGRCLETPQGYNSRYGFKLFASPYEAVTESTMATDIDTTGSDDEDVPQYGVGIFPKRMPELKPFSWQFPETMASFQLLRNRVTQDGAEQYIGSWQQAGLSTDVARAAVSWVRKCILDTIGRTEHHGLEIVPTEIQKMAINHLLKKGEDVLIASNAASGKTLAYLLPIIQKLKQHEKAKLRHPNSPRALILVPSRELADQTLNVLKGLGHIVKLSSEGIAGGNLKGRQRDHMKRLVDFVVATPDRLLKMIKHVKLHKLQYVVLDEADTLLNEGFWPEVAKVLDFVQHPYSLIQVAASSKYLLHFEKVQKALAKVPNMKGIPNKTPEVNEKYLNRMTQCHQLVETAWVDRPNRGVSHEFRYLEGKDKALELVNLIRYENARRCKKILVFCNNIQSCRAVEYILRDAGLPATSLHGKIPIMQRRRYYEDFINGSTGIMVCSDLASRGLDFNADAAIMFDFPLNSMDYLKRCGRVGRMINNDTIAPRGYAISLVKKRDRNLAIAIERSVRMPFFPISSLSRRKEDYNQRSGRLRHLTQAGGYFKLAKLIREEEIKGTYEYSNMDQYLEEFKGRVKEMYENSLKKIVLRRRRICKRRRILTRRLKLMKRYNRAIRLKQRIISEVDRNRRLNKFTIHSPMKGDDRRCPQMKDLRPIRAKILELKLMEDKMTRRLLERNDRYLRKFINKTQVVARSLTKPAVDSNELLDRQIPLNIIQRVKDKTKHKVRRICSLL